MSWRYPVLTLIVRNGIIRTMDPSRPLARAAAMDHGVFIAVGSEDEVTRVAGAGAESLDLAGGLALPGLVDAHLHLLWFGLGLSRPNLEGARSIAEAVSRLRPYLAKSTPGAWLVGSGWNEEGWIEGRWPDRYDLDALTPETPVLLRRKDGHSAWVNSRALAMAGITAATADPPGGRIDRDAEGEPTGVLREAAMDAVAWLVPEPGAAELDAALASATQAAHAVGLTGVHDMEDAGALAAFQRARALGELKLRVTAQIPAEHLNHALALGIRSGLGDDWVQMGALKIFADGSLGSRTAWMLEPYTGEPDNVGVAAMPPEELAGIVCGAVGAGIACSIHAIGDRANRLALDVLERHGGKGLRHRIEHVQVLHPADVPRLAQLGVVASMQPVHATADRDIADRWWGERVSHAYAWRSLLDAGATLAFGSDCPVETLDPLQGIYAAATRRRPAEAGGSPWHTEQCVSVEEAVRAYTVGPAVAGGQEDRRGMVRPGMLADLTVLTRDIVAAPAEEVLSARVACTVVGGTVVHHA